jgi:hypothetical protein
MDKHEIIEQVCAEMGLLEGGRQPAPAFDAYLELMANAVALIGKPGEQPGLDEDGYPLPPTIDFDAGREPTVVAIRAYFAALRQRNEAVLAQRSFDELVQTSKSSFARPRPIVLSREEMVDLQQLLGQLGALIGVSRLIAAEHRRRLETRLERLHLALRAHMPSLDMFWGLVGDARYTVGAAGREARQILDRLDDIAGILWAAESRSSI